MFIKTRTKYASKGGIELAVFEAFREVLVEVLSFGLRVVELVLVRLLTILFVDEQYCEQANEDQFCDPEPEEQYFDQDLPEGFEVGKFNPIL